MLRSGDRTDHVNLEILFSSLQTEVCLDTCGLTFASWKLNGRFLNSFTITDHEWLSNKSNYLAMFLFPLIDWLIDCVLTPLSAVFQLYHGDQFLLVEKAGENHRPQWTLGKQLGTLYYVRLFCNLRSWAWTHVTLVIGLYELLDPTT